VFGKLFFTDASIRWPATMASFATYAVGFFARPLGGIVFGHFGDKIGRKSMLVTTLMMMGRGDGVAIGLLPTYDAERACVGAHPARGCCDSSRDFGVGGEWGGAVLMAVEHGESRPVAGFYASWVQAGVPVGLLLANARLHRTLSSSIDRRMKKPSSPGAGACRF
jgi:MHS family shikimate/dehydroshikimate transporter-like MFS transporter